METKDQKNDIDDLMSFIEETREGKFSEDNISFRELLQCTITREDVAYFENDNSQNVGAVLYGLY